MNNNLIQITDTTKVRGFYNVESISPKGFHVLSRRL